MNFSYLQSLIEGAPYSLFYDIALHYLVGLGYKSPVVVDGKNDKGTDVTVDGRVSNIQLSVRKDWKDKVNEEAARYSDGESFTYITSRRVPRGEVDDFRAGSSYKKRGLVSFEIVDSQALASMLVRTNRAKLVCDLLGATWNPGDFSIKDSAAASLLLFSSESKQIRLEYIKWLVCSALLESNATPADLLNKLVDEQGIHESATAQLTGAIDSLLQMGVIRKTGAVLSLDEKRKGEIISARADFQGVFNGLPDYIKSSVCKVVEGAEVSDEDAKNIADIAIQKASLIGSENGVKTSLIDDVVRRYGIVDIVQKEAFYRLLASHRVFQLYGMSNVVSQILRVDRSDLFASLQAKGQINFYLDSSVAIPMVLSLLYGKGSGRYSFVGAAIYGELKRLNFPLFIPDVYISEMAAHAYLSLDEYRLVSAGKGESRDALKRSGNVFVNHFARFSKNVSYSDFVLFMRDFDIREGVARDRNISNSQVMMTTILSGYGIKPFQTSVLGNVEIKNFLRGVRPNAEQILIENDSRVIRTIKSLPPEQRNIVCSWDTGLRQYSRENTGVFECFSPPVLMDVLNFVFDDYSEDVPNFNVLDAFLFDIEPEVQRINSDFSVIRDGADIDALRIKRKVDTSQSAD